LFYGINQTNVPVLQIQHAILLDESTDKVKIIRFFRKSLNKIVKIHLYQQRCAHVILRLLFKFGWYIDRLSRLCVSLFEMTEAHLNSRIHWNPVLCYGYDILKWSTLFFCVFSNTLQKLQLLILSLYRK